MSKKNAKKEKRERWVSRAIFMFAAIGAAVGLANVWRFPYLAGKYGGTFLIPYLIMLFVLGIPMLILEFGLGQKMQRAAVGSFGKIRKYLAPIGYSAIFFGFIICSYYAVMMAWLLIYFFNSFAVNWADAPKEYFFDGVLQITSGIGDIGGINWIVFCALVAVWALIYICIRKGIKSIEKAVIVTLPLSFILVLVLVARGVTLPSASEGLLYFMRPDFAALLDLEVWSAAVSQVFFTLGLAFGVMFAYASYNESEDVIKNAWIVAIVNVIVSLAVGLAVFGALGFMASQQGAAVSELSAAGPGLVFIAYPQALSMMPMAAFFSVVFFAAVFGLAISSAFGMIWAVLAVISDRWASINKRWLAVAVCALGFLSGIIYTTKAGFYFIDVVDHFAAGYGLVLVGIAECIAVGWIFGAHRLTRYVNSVSDWKISEYWEFFIRYAVPALLVAFIAARFVSELKDAYGDYPVWATMMGWIFVAAPILLALLISLILKKKY